MASGNGSDEYIGSYCDECSQKKGYHVKINAFCKTCNLRRCVDNEVNHQTLEKDDKYEVVRGKAVPFYQQKGRTSYQRCDKHSKSEYYLDRFCEHHACLVCLKCAKKVHAKCSVVPVKAMCRRIRFKEIKDFEREIEKKREDLVETKSNLHITMSKRLADQHDAVLDKCEDMFIEQEAKLKCLRMQFLTELDMVFNEQSKKISRQIAEIDTVVESLDEVYRDIQTIEREYIYEDEDIFLKIQESVVKINHNLEHFRRMENSFVNVSLQFLANEELNQFITSVNSLGTLKTRIKSSDIVLRVDNIAFAPTSHLFSE